MSGELPRTTSGTPSYSLARARIDSRVGELLDALQREYGLTDLEMADVLAETARGFIRSAVRGQQKRSKARAGAIGTPGEE